MPRRTARLVAGVVADIRSGNPVGVAQPFADHSPSHHDHLLQRVQGPLIVPSRKLADLPVPVLAAEVVVYPDTAPLQH